MLSSEFLTQRDVSRQTSVIRRRSSGGVETKTLPYCHQLPAVNCQLSTDNCHLSTVNCHLLSRCRQQHLEGGAFPLAAFCPDHAAMVFHYFSYDRQPYAGALVFGIAMQACKHIEDPFGILGVEADAVVAHFDQVKR